MKRIRNTIFLYITILLVIFLTFSLLKGYIEFPEWILYLGYTFLCILMYPKVIKSKHFFYLILYGIFLIIRSILGHEKYTYGFTAGELAYLFAATLMIDICLLQNNNRNLFTIFFVGISITFITSLLTIPLLMTDANLVRLVASSAVENNIGFLKQYQRLGVSSYAMIHSIPFILPIIVFQIKQRQLLRNRLVWILLLMVLFFLEIKSSVTTTILLSILGISLSLFLSDNYLRNFRILFGWGILFFLFVNEKNLILVLEIIEPYFRDTAVHGKIFDFQDSMMYSRSVGQISNRESLYDISWNTFINNPLFGSSLNKDSGGHAFFIDHLARIGIIGCLPLFLFLFYHFKLIFSILNRNVRFYYMVGVIMFMLLGFTKNILGFEFWFYLFFILPSLSFYSMKSNIEHKLN